jgi:galactonate dehydratase
MPNLVVQEVCGQVKPTPIGKIWEAWFGFPAMRMVDGRFPLSGKAGLAFELSEASLAKYPFGDTHKMARVFMTMAQSLSGKWRSGTESAKAITT